MSSRLDRYIPLAQRFAARVILFHADIARRAGLTATELHCLRLIANGGSTATELARNTGLTLPAMTAVVDRLEAMRFVTRERDPDDRRRVLLKTNRRATARVDALYAGYTDRIAVLLKEFKEAEFEAIMRYLGEVADLLEREVSQPAGKNRRSPVRESSARLPLD